MTQKNKYYKLSDHRIHVGTPGLLSYVLLFILMGFAALVPIDLTAQVTLGSPTTFSNDGRVLTFSHTVEDGSDRLLIVGIGFEDGDEHVVSVRYGGNNLSLIARRSAKNNDDDPHVSAWYLVDPPVGTHTVQVVFSDNGEAGTGAISFAGVDQGNPIGNITAASAENGAPNITIRSFEGAVVMDVIAHAKNVDDGPHPGNGQTQLWRLGLNGDGPTTGASIREGGNGDVSMTWQNASGEWAAIGFNINPAEINVTDAGQTEITADPTTILANGTSTSTVTVTVRDEEGNRIPSGGDDIQLFTTAGSLGPVTDRNDGTYTATLTSSTTSGIATITGLFNGEPIDDFATVRFLGTQPRHFQFTANTGNNATVYIPVTAEPAIDGELLNLGDEIGIFTPAGLCVGAAVWTGINIGITVWGNNEQTPELDGIRNGELMHYRAWREETDTEYPNIEVEYDDSSPFTRSDGLYAADAIYVLRALDTYPPPPAPELVSPENESINLLAPVAFSWGATDKTETYTFELATNSAFTSPVVSIDTLSRTEFTVDNLEFSTTYYWRVRSVNLAGAGDWSDTWSFSTLAPPTAPVLVSPDQDATDIAIPVTFQWEQTELADAYSVEVATDNAFSSIIYSGSGIGDTSIVPEGITFDTRYFWRVNAGNVAGTSPWSATRSFTTFDKFLLLTNPERSTVWIENSNEQIRWSSRGIEELRIEYTTDDGTIWSTIAETVDAALGEYTWSVPGEPSTTVRIRISDQANDNLTVTSPRFSIYPNRVNLNISMTFGEPTSVNSYRMVGLPGNVDLPMATVLGGTGGRDWTAFYDTGGEGTEDEYLIEFDGTNRFNFRPGRGFWLLSKNGMEYNNEHNSVPLNEDGIFEIDIHGGWNIIANPFGIPIPWSDIQEANDLNALSDRLWDYSGTFAQSSTMQPYRGYYYYNSGTETRLSIPYPNADIMQKPAADPADVLRALTVTLSERSTPLSDIMIGMLAETDEDIDRMRVIAPPSDFESKSIRLLSPAPGVKSLKLHTEYRRDSDEGYRFELQVRIPPSRTFQMDFSGLEHFSDDRVVLLHRRSGKEFDIQVLHTINVSSDTGLEEFDLLIGSDTYLQSEREKIIPAELTLGQNYPNPFNPTTTIEFSIPHSHEAVPVSLTIYNMLGQQVRTLVHRQTGSGFYSIEWDGRNDNGVTVPSGLYIYRLTAGTTQQTKRMLFIK
jgi:hypothetical protein